MVYRRPGPREAAPDARGRERERERLGVRARDKERWRDAECRKRLEPIGHVQDLITKEKKKQKRNL